MTAVNTPSGNNFRVPAFNQTVHELQRGSTVELMKLEKIWTWTGFCSAKPNPNSEATEIPMTGSCAIWWTTGSRCFLNARSVTGSRKATSWNSPGGSGPTPREKPFASRWSARDPNARRGMPLLKSFYRHGDVAWFPRPPFAKPMIFTVSASSSHLASDGCPERDRLRLKLSRGPHVAGDLGQLEMTCPD